MENCLIVLDVQNNFINEHTIHTANKIGNLTLSKDFDNVIAVTYNPIKFVKSKSGIGHNEPINPEADTSLYEAVKRYDLLVETSYLSAVVDQVLQYLNKKSVFKIYLSGIGIDKAIICTMADFWYTRYCAVVMSDYCTSIAGEYKRESDLDELIKLFGQQNVKHNYQAYNQAFYFQKVETAESEQMSLFDLL